jgi:lipopolysaccharide export system protein LptA
VLILVLGNYFQNRQHARNRSTEKPHQILSSDMARSAESTEYLERRNGMVAFKIRAEKHLETRLGKNFLQGIEGFDFNPDGSVRNEIRSRNAVYNRETGSADFSGDVRMFFSRGTELRTNSFHYDLGTSVGTTQDSLEMLSSNVKGKARGARFDREKDLLELGSEVDLYLTRKVANPDGPESAQTMHVSSQTAVCSEKMRRFLFRGNVRLESDSTVLTGDEVEAELGQDQKQITSLIASGRATYQLSNAKETRTLSGDRMVFAVNASGRALENISVIGNALFAMVSPLMEYDLHGDGIDLALDESGELPVQIQSRTRVRFRLKRGAEQTSISGEQLWARVSPETRSLESITVKQHAKMFTAGRADSMDNELQANEIQLSFRQEDGNAVPQRLLAEGSAQWMATSARRGESAAGSPTRSLTAATLEMLYAAKGDSLESANASGNVALAEIPLEVNALPQARRLYADRVQFHFFPGTSQLKDMDADGHVRVTYEKKDGSSAGSAVKGFRTASDRMRATFESASGDSVLVAASQWGSFLYEEASRSARAGRCDYDARTEILKLRESPRISDTMGSTTGEQVEYDQKRKILSVFRRVRSVLSTQKEKSAFWGSSSSSSPSIILADSLEYWTESARARYMGKVQWLSENQQLQAEELEILNNGDRVDAHGGIRNLVSRKESPDSVKDKPKKVQNGKEKDASKPPPPPINIQSSGLRYLREKNTVTYSGNVLLQSGDVVLRSEMLDAELDAEGKEITQVTARNKVVIHQGSRECKGDTAYYYLDPGKFEVLGNPAEISDPGRMRSKGRRLTSFTADDRILLENQ